MITKINKSNSGSYKDLFRKVSLELMKYDSSSFTEVEFGSPNAIIPCKPATVTEDTYVADTYYVKNAEGKFEKDTFGVFKEGTEYYEADAITSLNEYFHYIDRIKEIKGGMYTRLPLDESLFLIDADKRSITVPPAFVTNGVSVQGDEISETLYFKIDRYFDATDLATQNVFIEWRNATGEEGVSFPWVFDIETEPNYIIFGWPLSSRITKNAGTIQFTVRFYTRDEQDETAERLIYSFSTLTHTVTIKPGLNFNLVDLLLNDHGAIDDATELISQRFTSSPLAGSGSEVASIPTFLDMEIIGFVGPRDQENPNVYMNLGGANYDEDINLITQAITEDAGQLSYSWKRKELINNKTGNSIPLDSKPVFEMRETQDTAPVDGKTYYQRDELSNAYAQFVPTIWDKDDEDYVVIYERFSVITINSTGAYWVVAKNRVASASAETQSATIIVPNPVVPVIEEGQNLPENQVLVEDRNYQATLTSNAKTAVTTENSTGAGVLSYQWKRSDTEDGEYANIDGAIEKTFAVDGDTEAPAEGEAEITRPVGDGYYKVETTTSLNKESKSVESSVCRITHPASKMTVNCTSNLKTSLANAMRDGLSVEALFPEGCGENYDYREDLGDKITYQWYRYYAGNSNLDLDLVKAAAGNYIVNGDDFLGDGKIKNPSDDPSNPDDDFILGDDLVYIDLGSQTATFHPDVQGYYFCEVTNTFSGTTAKRCSDFFNVAEY